MMPPMRKILVAAALLAMTLAGCAPADEAAAPANSVAAGECTKDSMETLEPGFFTFATDEPAYHPWFINNDPTNGQGYESAVAYAVAEKLGYTRAQVNWVRVPFLTAIAPGAKKFDAAISEFSITAERRQAVDFSSPYLNVTQAFIAMPGTPAASVTTLDELKSFRLGAGANTTSYTAAAALGGSEEVSVYATNEDARAALSAGQIDVLVLDLPTAFSVQFDLPGSVVVGQLDPEPAERYGLVLDKGSALTPCVSQAIDTLGDNGDFFRMQKEWLAGPGTAPFLT